MSDSPITPEDGVVTEPIVAPEAPKPTETVEFWKQKSREQEARAKANADAAIELEKIKDSQKTEQQKQADATTAAIREAAEARAESLAYRLAATHGVTPDNFDLLGTGDEATITARAERVGGFLKVQAENAQLRAEIEALKTGKPAPITNRPIADLKPGATPDPALSESDQLYASLYGTK